MNRRVVTQPSSKTSYVVLGADAGPSKLAAIKKHGLSTLDEDGFLSLIATRQPDPKDEKLKKKLEKEQDTIRQAAHELERREKKEAKSDATYGVPLIFSSILDVLAIQGRSSDESTVDRPLCATYTQGSMWQQRSSREATALVT